MDQAMPYFTGKASALFPAKSGDLLDWTDTHGGQPVLKPEKEYIIRDLFLFRDAQGLFYVLFIDNWESISIGHVC